MKTLDKIAQLTDDQLTYGLLKYLGYDIFDCSDHDETSPHYWPGNNRVTEIASEKGVITIGLTGAIHFENKGTSQPIHFSDVVGMELNRIVVGDGVCAVRIDGHGDYVVSTYMGMDPEATCHVHGKDLYKALCYGFIMYHCNGTIDVPDILVK